MSDDGLGDNSSADELTQLQTATPADLPATVRTTVESELGQPLDELFAEFELVSIASASIAFS